MKLSVEAKLVAAVAVAFVAVAPGAMAQGHGKGQGVGSNHYGLTNNSGVNNHMSQQGENSSLFGRNNVDQNKPTFSDEHVTSSGREQREARHDAREQREARHDAREQRQDRQQARRQREERHLSTSTPKEKSPFDGSILDVKPADINR
jgi:hypothetical protein